MLTNRREKPRTQVDCSIPAATMHSKTTESVAALYNTLPDIHEAARSVAHLEATVLPGLANLLVKFGLETSFNICLVHNHFQLTDGESVVELDGPDGSVSSVFKAQSPDDDIVLRYNLDVPANPAVVGDTFLVRDGSLIPYEFRCVSEFEFIRSPDVIGLKESGFLEEWETLLKSENIVDKLGLQWKSTGEVGRVVYEVAHPVERIHVRTRPDSTAFPRHDLQNYISTVWEITNVGTAPVVDRLAWCYLCAEWQYCPACQAWRYFRNGLCEVCGSQG